jgi:hypothetical protein
MIGLATEVVTAAVGGTDRNGEPLSRPALGGKPWIL